MPRASSHAARLAAPGQTPAALAAVPPLAELVGADVQVPLVTGGTTRYVNLDLAASAPALRPVADRVAELLPLYSSVHRGAGYASAVCTAAYEAARGEIAAFVGVRAEDVVQIVRNTTDALNLLATAVPGPVVHLDVEHHANLLPWQRIGGRVVSARATLAQTLEAVEAAIVESQAALLAVTGASNVTGEVLPIAQLASLAHAHGARIAVDGAQLVPHRRIDVAELEVDYLAFSGHKLYAPFGAGALIGHRDWLEAAPAYLAGGGAVRQVSVEGTSWAPVPARHEAGTPNVIGAVALAAACQTLAALPDGALAAHETTLSEQLRQGLDAIPGVRVLALWPGEAERIGVVSFTVDGHPAELVAQYLSAEHGIGVRDGRFCAHPLLARLTGGATAVRASLGVGSASGDVHRLVTAIAGLVADGPGWRYADAAGDYLPLDDPRALPEWIAAAALPGSPCGT